MTEASTSWVEQALEHDFNAALLDTLGALVCVIDQEGRIVRFNRASEKLSGYTIAEVREQPFWELLIPPDEVEGVKKVVRDLVDRQLPSEWENHWITKGGARRRIRWSNTVLRAGGRVAWIIGTGIDITDRQLAEDAYGRLLTEERRARALAERAERCATFLAEAGPSLQSAVLDEAGVVDALARHAVPFLADWCAVRLVGTDGMTRTSAFVHADPEVARRLSPLNAFPVPTRGGRPFLVREGTSRTVNGRAACLASLRDGLAPAFEAQLLQYLQTAGLAAYMAVPLTARDRTLGVVLFASARDERTYGPEDLMLAQALALRAALAVDNARLYRHLQQALQAREDFLVVASHELKTPLASLQVAVQALLGYAGASGGPPWGAPLLGAVQRSTTRLARLVEDILDISGLTAETPVPALQDVDLGAVVAEAVSASAEALSRAGCTARIDARGPARGRWDRRWLFRVVTHLLANAAKYGPGQRIEIGVEGGAETVRLTVRDHGIGIPAEEQARIFERFERAVPVRHYGGLGLGLWLVRRRVEALGGAVHVESRPGEGATFTVELPTSGPKAA